jgi:hypothetical protein
MYKYSKPVDFDKLIGLKLIRWSIEKDYFTPADRGEEVVDPELHQHSSLFVWTLSNTKKKV